MRKRSAFFAPLALAGVLFLSCSIESGVAEPEPDPQTDPAFYLVTVDEARAGVESLLADLDPPTRGSARTISETIVSGGFGATRSGDGPEEPLYYIFNFTNDEGFAVTSGDSRTPPVFCVTDTGSFDAEALAKVPGAAMTFISYDTDYRVTVGLPVPGPDGVLIRPGEPDYPGGTAWIGDVVTGIGNYTGGEPLSYEIGPWTERSRYGTPIAAEWGQNAPYNNKLPYWGYNDKGDLERAVTGCATTAVAQILYHYQYPSSINGRPLHWMAIRPHTSNDNSYFPAHENIAILFQELVKPEYLDASFADSDEKNSTSVNKSRVTKTLRKLGYNTNDVADYNSSAVINAIKQGRPVMMRGNSHRRHIIFGWYSYSNGHVWICDHLIVRTRAVKVYQGGVFVRTETQEQKLIHCNWGWSRLHNGYFLPTRFDVERDIDPEGTRSEGVEDYYRFNIEMWDCITR